VGELSSLPAGTGYERTAVDEVDEH
jgi:hypothetical protein